MQQTGAIAVNLVPSSISNHRTLDCEDHVFMLFIMRATKIGCPCCADGAPNGLLEGKVGYLDSKNLGRGNAQPLPGLLTHAFFMSTDAVTSYTERRSSSFWSFALGQPCVLTVDSPGPCYAYFDNLDPAKVYSLWNSQA